MKLNHTYLIFQHGSIFKRVDDGLRHFGFQVPKRDIRVYFCKSLHSLYVTRPRTIQLSDQGSDTPGKIFIFNTAALSWAYEHLWQFSLVISALKILTTVFLQNSEIFLAWAQQLSHEPLDSELVNNDMNSIQL